MTSTAAIDLDKALLDPDSVFYAPHDVLHAQGLSPQDKKAVLLRWKEDAEDLMRATGEGMPPEGQRSPAELLRAVDLALETLERETSHKGCCC
jgi:hypothetical protein